MTVAERPPSPWLSYDSVAGTYEAVAVPWFTPLARDLVAAVAPAAGETILDVGTGTGLVARTIGDAQPKTRVVGMDPSPGMLEVARPHVGGRAAVAMAPGLPFADRAFDVIVANLVLSHLPDRSAGIADIVRVLRPGGRLGCTAWSSPASDASDNDRPAAEEIVVAVQSELGLDVSPPRDAAALEEWFHDPARLGSALSDAGLGDIAVHRQEYRWTFTVAELLSGWGCRGRYLRHYAGQHRWQCYIERASEALAARFGDRIRVVHGVWIATATRVDN